MFDVSSIINSVGTFLQSDAGRVLTQVGSSVLGDAFTGSEYNDAARQYSGNIQGAANILNEGYDDQLENIEQRSDVMRDLAGGSLAAQDEITRQADAQYGQRTRQAYMQYLDYLLPEFQQYSDEQRAAIADYVASTGELESDVASFMEQGAAGYNEQYQPYTEAGDDALAYMRSTLQEDPSRLTSSQRSNLADYEREALATLASSGLRGAGRAGIAAVNVGRGKMLAAYEDENRRRQDEMARTLNSQGYSATGNVANNTRAAADARANLRFQVGSDAATKQLGAESEIAKGGMALAEDMGNKFITGQGNIAAQGLNTANTRRSLQDQYFTNLGAIEGSRYTGRGDSAFQKANTMANVAQQGANVQYNTDVTNAGNTASTIGKVGATITDYLKQQAAKKSQPNTQVYGPWPQ